MIDCQDVTHVWGVNQHGKWVEQYRFDDLVLHQNYPPHGQHSRTPVDRVGVENGFCVVQFQEQAPAPIETVIEPVLSPTAEEPVEITVNHLMAVFMLCVLGWIGFNFFKKKYEPNPEPEQPQFLNPWADPNSRVNYQMQQVYPRSQQPLPSPYVRPEELDDEDLPNSHASDEISMVPPSSHRPTRYDSPGPLDTNPRPTRYDSPGPLDTNDRPTRYDFPAEKEDHYEQIVSKMIPNLARSVGYLLPFDPAKDVEIFEYESFLQIKITAPDIKRDELIKVMWAKSKGSSVGYTLAKNRYEKFMERRKEFNL